MLSCLTQKGSDEFLLQGYLHIPGRGYGPWNKASWYTVKGNGGCLHTSQLKLSSLLFKLMCYVFHEQKGVKTLNFSSLYGVCTLKSCTHHALRKKAHVCPIYISFMAVFEWKHMLCLSKVLTIWRGQGIDRAGNWERVGSDMQKKGCRLESSTSRLFEDFSSCARGTQLKPNQHSCVNILLKACDSPGNMISAP